MPAAAVIPAPIAYIKVVAVKTPVVEFLGVGGIIGVLALVNYSCFFSDSHFKFLVFGLSCYFTGVAKSFPSGGPGMITLKKLECSKRAF